MEANWVVDVVSKHSHKILVRKFIPDVKNYLNIKNLLSVRPNGDAKLQNVKEKKIKEPP